MTLVALSLASSQQGPRLLRNFDAAGTPPIRWCWAPFRGYVRLCVLVLRTIGASRGGAFRASPRPSAFGTVAGHGQHSGWLIYFIPSRLASRSRPMRRAGSAGNWRTDRQAVSRPLGSLDPNPRMRRLMPTSGGVRHARPVPWAPVEDGFISADRRRRPDWPGATEEDLLLRLERRPGHYLVKGRALVMGLARDRVTETLVDKLNAAFGSEPAHCRPGCRVSPSTSCRDRRAGGWSPGINGPVHAMFCVGSTGARALCGTRPTRHAVSPAIRPLTGGLRAVMAPGALVVAGSLDTAFQPDQAKRSCGNPAAGRSAIARMLSARSQGHMQTRAGHGLLQRHAGHDRLEGRGEAVREAGRSARRRGGLHRRDTGAAGASR